MNFIDFQVKSGKVYATATEDMDALTFGSNVLLRHLTFSEARKMPIQEIHLDKVLEGLNLNQKEVRKHIFGYFQSEKKYIGFCILFLNKYT